MAYDVDLITKMPTEPGELAAKARDIDGKILLRNKMCQCLVKRMKIHVSEVLCKILCSSRVDRLIRS